MSIWSTLKRALGLPSPAENALVSPTYVKRGSKKPQKTLGSPTLSSFEHSILIDQPSITTGFRVWVISKCETCGDHISIRATYESDGVVKRLEETLTHPLAECCDGPMKLLGSVQIPIALSSAEEQVLLQKLLRTMREIETES